jgi:hypothetical protein
MVYLLNVSVTTPNSTFFPESNPKEQRRVEIQTARVSNRSQAVYAGLFSPATQPLAKVIISPSLFTPIHDSPFPFHDTSSTRTTLSCFARFVLRTSSVAVISLCRIFSCLAQPRAEMRMRAMKRAMERNVFRDGLEDPSCFCCRLGTTSCLRLPRIWVRMCSSSRSCALLLQWELVRVLFRVFKCSKGGTYHALAMSSWSWRNFLANAASDRSEASRSHLACIHSICMTIPRSSF